MGRFQNRLLIVAILALMVQFFGLATPAAGAHSDPVIINSLNDTGRYLELTDDSLDVALDAANADGIAFAWLDQGGDSRVAESLADDFIEDLDEIGSRYRTVMVLTSEGFAASSTAFTSDQISAALDASFDSFAAGAASRGVDQFSLTLSGFLSGQTTATTTGNGAGTGGAGSGGGIGFGTIILGIAVLGGGFLMFRRFSNNRKLKRQEAIETEEDRAEIKEQLKNNADRVITLGDRVIASGNQQLIKRYEEASATYQDVSQSVDGAQTGAEVDELDDRIDHAEWQFEAIEAELSGLPIPRSPAERAAAEIPAPTAPAPSGQNDDTVVTSPRTGRQYPAPGASRSAGRRRTTGRSTGRSRGMGGMGGALGSILGSIVLNGGLGGQSRRSQRRSGGMGGGLGDILSGGNRRTTSNNRRSGGSGGFGGLGGGVLKRGGSSSGTRRNTRTGSSGRSRSTRSRGRGGRSF
ncbi:MAG: hypothetical protein ACRBK7_31690 [Acidimicrobiales bacterium]